MIFVEAERIQELNNTYLGKNEPTDVLAFPIDSQKLTTGETPTLLGDVVICPAKAKENASAQKKNHDEEIALLVLHGILHILGYDHAYPEEKAVMKNTLRAKSIRSKSCKVKKRHLGVNVVIIQRLKNIIMIIKYINAYKKL